MNNSSNEQYLKILSELANEYFETKKLSTLKVSELKEVILLRDPKQFFFFFDSLKREEFVGELNDIFIELVPFFPEDKLDDKWLFDTLYNICSYDKLVPTLEKIIDKVNKTEFNMQIINSSFYDQIMSKLTDNDEFILEVENLTYLIKKYQLKFDEKNNDLSNISHCIFYHEKDDSLNSEVNVSLFEKKLYVYCKIIHAYGLFEQLKMQLSKNENTILAFTPKKEKEVIKNIINSTLEKVQIEGIVEAKNNVKKLKI